ncbi:TIM barrel protein [Paenibacillus sp. YIM B09110]|uniref:TIM barrel protein n=1 Tax=Paenibacillus sp. YIM B09110 TaxID=3126102 RepID=UPI00301E30B8
MELKLFKALWGMEGGYEELFAKAAAAGYAGIEAPLPQPSESKSFAEGLQRHGLAYVAQIFTEGDHLASFEQSVERAAEFRPILIVSHSARDSMTENEQDRFFAGALAAEKHAGIPVGHETHRSRAMFTPWTTARLLRKFPELRITADFSHWVNVSESYLENHEEEIALTVERTIHIHGRIGFPQGPQVPHPAAPEYRTELTLFTKWWHNMFAEQKRRNQSYATFTAEFGPPGYMPTEPFTNKPVVDLWEVNQWTTDYIMKNFNEWF